MKKYKTFKTGTVVFFVLSLVFSLGWLGVFGFNGFDSTKTADMFFNFQGFWSNWLLPRLELMLGCFTGTSFGFLPAAEGDFNFLVTYGVYAACGITLILIIIGLIVTLKYPRKRYWPYALVMLLATFAICEVAVMLPGYYIQYLTFSFPPEHFYDVLFSFLTIICAGLAYIFMVACCIWGMLRARQLAKKTEEPEEEAEPEAVEEEIAEEPAPVEEKPLEEDLGETFATIPDEDSDVEVEETAETPTDETVMSDFEVEPEEMVEQPEEVVVEEVPQDDNLVRKDDLATILRDVVRDIVRDEIARANSSKEEDRRGRGEDRSIVGATFGGPLVVQYFNGGINTQPGPQVVPQPVVTQTQTPAAEEKKEETKEESPTEVKPAEEPAPVVETPAAEEAEEEKNPIIRIPFTERMLSAEKGMQNDYNELKNEILSYGVNSRVSNSGDTFRLHRKTYVKITIAGKSLKLYFALDPADYADSKMPIGDASHHAVYAEIPLIFKVKSGLSMRRAKELIRDVMSKDGLEQGEVGSVNWVKELKANAKK